MKKICIFKGVEISFKMKHDDSIIEKGKYDFEFLKHQTQLSFYLRIKKKRKAVCVIRGEELAYKSSDYYEKSIDPNIPEQAKLKFLKNPKGGIVDIIFESGKRAIAYPCVKLRFRMEYEE
ncbi:MAG: hypothetical protein JSV96_00065 [Candidatus Aminicenantes bacterium]|nr:MAG: hypothetical protein JSV96_00065 [Candidatus Aminicenantes bacterium]